MYTRFVLLQIFFSLTASANQTAAPTPEKLLADALATRESYILHFRKTGELSDLAQTIGPAREKADTAYRQFLAKSDYANAAQSLVAIAGFDRMLVMQNPSEYQAKQSPVKQEYEDALKLALKAKDAASQFKALKGLSLANQNSKDYSAAAGQISQAIDLAAKSGNKDDLFGAYQAAADLERLCGNLSAASDYLDRALNMRAQVKDASLLWFAYTTRADIYNTRADACDFNRQLQFCQQIFDSGMQDIRQAAQVADRLGLDFLKNESLKELNNRKMLADLHTQSAAMAAKLREMNTLITKPSQVIVEPRFADGPSPDLAAEVRSRTKQLTGPENMYDPMGPYTKGKLKEWDGDADGALQNYLEAVKLLENDRRKTGDVDGAGAFLNDKIDIYYAAALQHLDRRQYAPAFDLIERSRARALAEMLAGRNLSFRTPELQDLYSRSVALRAQIGKAQNNLFDALGSTNVDTAKVHDLQAKVDTLQQQNRLLEAKLQQSVPKLAADLGGKPPVSLDAAQAAARNGNYDLLYFLSLDHATLLWLINGDSVHVLKIFYSRAQLADRVAKLRQSLSDPNSTFDKSLATELFLVLVNPVFPYIHTNHLVVVPHEDLSNLPLQILLNPTDSSYLGEQFQISYAPSATILAQLGRPPDFADGRLFAVADPAITNAVAEVNAIGELYPGRANLLTATLAGKSSLKSQAANYNLLHLSVHGVFEENNPLLSYLKLRPSAGDDGRLTAAEMFGLPLPDNSLVVLSACETGRVRASHGNDVLGMVPALLFSGASTLVLSSWKVDAASTAIWMKTFYREARANPPSQAALLALRAVKQHPEFQHPFYWAPFLLTGR